MAELLIANGLLSGNALAANLSEALTGDYYVISEPRVRGQALDAIVVGPQGLIVLYALEWHGDVTLSQRGAWSEHLADGRQVAHPGPAKVIAASTRALRAYLADEMANPDVEIRHIVVFTDRDVTISGEAPAGAQVLRSDDLMLTIVAEEGATPKGLPDAAVRRDLAEGLAEGRLGIHERTAQPFVFRSSGVLGLRRKVWTIDEAIRHMDRNADDGMAHLRNGTFVRWLEENNAQPLANTARQCMRGHPNDMHAALEEFLLATGLVARPRLLANPRKIRLGYVQAGQSVRCELRIRRGRGRGYLYGSVRPRETWLRVVPSTIERGSLLATVSAETEGLQIATYRTAIDVESSASAEPLAIPVYLRLTPTPSHVDRALVRPLVAGLAAGVLGAGVGMAATRIGAPTPYASFLAAYGIAPALFWPILAGVLWLLLGVVRGVRQAPAWPIPYALARWVGRTLFWAVALAGLATIVLVSGQQFAAEAGFRLMEGRQALVLALAVVAAALPATAGENQSAAAAQEGNLDNLSHLAQRPTMVAGVALVLLMVAVVGVRIVDEARRTYVASPEVDRAEEWIAEHWGVWEKDLTDAVDRLFVRFYEERAR